VTLKGHFALCYANCAILWLDGKSYAISNSTVKQDDDEFLIYRLSDAVFRMYALRSAHPKDS